MADGILLLFLAIIACDTLLVSPCLWHPAYDILPSACDFLYVTPSRWHPTCNTLPLTTCIWHPAYDTLLVTPSMWHPACDTLHMASCQVSMTPCMWDPASDTLPVTSCSWHPAYDTLYVTPYLWHPAYDTLPACEESPENIEASWTAVKWAMSPPFSQMSLHLQLIIYDMIRMVIIFFDTWMWQFTMFSFLPLNYTLLVNISIFFLSCSPSSSSIFSNTFLILDSLQSAVLSQWQTSKQLKW